MNNLKDLNIDKILCEKYPLIFADRNKSMRETCMHWGISTGPGWFNILDQLCANIQWYIDSTNKSRNLDIEYNSMRQQARLGNWEPFNKYFSYSDLDMNDIYVRDQQMILNSKSKKLRKLVPQVIASQVKEKYGTLRFYYSGGDSTVDGMVRMAEAMSEVTCETCGAPGEIIGEGWLSVICEEHKHK